MSTFRLQHFRMQTLNDLAPLEQTPLDDQGLASSTYELLQDSATLFAERRALRFLLTGMPDEEPVDYSYAEVLANVTQTANALHQLSVGPGDCVSMLLPNLPQTLFTIWGAEAAGIFNPINPLLEVEHIVALLNETQCAVLVTLAPMPGSDLWQKAHEAMSQVPTLKTLITVDPLNFISREQRAHLSAGREEYLSEQVLDFDQLIKGQESQRLLSERTIQSSDCAAYFHTGGTTGVPKLVPHTHANQIACAFQLAISGDAACARTTLIGLPLFHVNAVFTTLSSWLGGGGIVLATAQGYRTAAVMQNFWPLVEKHQINVFSAVPTILTGLLAFPIGDHDVSSLEYAICGAAPLAAELARQFEQKTGLVIIEGYGQTEGTCASAITPRYGKRRSGAVGCRLPYMQIRIVEVDEKTGVSIRDCDTDEVGCIAINGPNVFSGYKQEQHNVGQWVEPGWFNTGDLGRIDTDGYLWLAGRSKDLIIRGGHNIDPQMIEEALFKHMAVADVAAIGQPDVKVGELPVAYVQLKKGQVVDADELLRFAGEHIPERAAVPKAIIFVDHMPLTAVGKIFKPDLRCDSTQRVIQRELEGLSIPSYGLTVEQHKRYGQLATITVASPDQQRQVSEALALYPFKSEVELSL